jgi:pimeloyl-ACP methyl ester carboxylesterase
MRRIILHLGGNGHASVRLEPARRALGRVWPDVELVDVPYPGFEGRPGVASWEGFLDDLARSIRSLEVQPLAAYASGVGALVALGLRARGELEGVPLIFQGAVLWGLEERWFPWLMRFRPARGWLQAAFAIPRFQRRFARKQFQVEHDPAMLARFFEGYAACSAFGDFFDWLAPGYLRTLEQAFAARPDRFQGVTVWLGGRDHVVGLAEVEATRRAIAVDWPVVTFPTWGHYPALDVPEEWADALRRALAPA